MSSPTTYQKAKLSLAMLGINGLPFDEYLSELPPLPDSPHYSRHIDDIPEGIVTEGISRHSTPIAPPLCDHRKATSSEGSHEGTPSGTLGEKTLWRLGNMRGRIPLATQPMLSADHFREAKKDREPIALHAPSPVQSTLQPSSTSHLPSPPPPESGLPAPRLSASFRIPNMGDASLIADCSLFGGASSSMADDSLEYELHEFRPKGRGDFQGEEKEGGGKNIGVGLQVPAVRHLNHSTILPSSPAKSAHLLASTNAIYRADPPWNRDISVLSNISDDSGDAATLSRPSSPTRQSSHKSQSIPYSGSGSLCGFPTSNSKRTFPASSSGSSLAAVGEEGEQGLDPEISTLLPASPQKAPHLLHGNETIAAGRMLEEESSLRPHPPYPLRAQKDRRRMVDEMGDVTMDVKDLMAKVGKPKRASGTEESFVDLLHTDDMLNGMDMTMMIGDETMMLPSKLRPERSTLPASPAKSTGIHAVKQHTTALPTSQSNRMLSSPEERAPGPTPQAGLVRSKSLSRVAEIIARVKEGKTSQAQRSARPLSPPKTAVTARYYTTHDRAAPAATPVMPRSRIGAVPHTTGGSRRISLSAGAVPMPRSASQKAITLPGPQSAVTQVARSRPQLPTSHQPSSSLSRFTPASKPTAEARPSSLTARVAPATVSRATRNSLAPLGTQVSAGTRIGSASSSVTSTAAMPRLPTATGTSATARATRTSTLGGASSSAASAAASRAARPSGVSGDERPLGLPKPGSGPSARSAPNPGAERISTTARQRPSRTFGGDATATTNRLSRPPPSFAPSAETKKPVSRLSAGPTTSASSRLRPISTTATTVAQQSTLPLSRTSRTGRQSTRPLPITGEIPRSRAGSTLPRPSTTRVPPPTGKSSAPPGSTGGSGAGMAALRLRLDQLQSGKAAGVSK